MVGLQFGTRFKYLGDPHVTQPVAQHTVAQMNGLWKIPAELENTPTGPIVKTKNNCFTAGEIGAIAGTLKDLLIGPKLNAPLHELIEQWTPGSGNRKDDEGVAATYDIDLSHFNEQDVFLPFRLAPSEK